MPITIVGDDVAEGDESVFVRFSEADTARTKGMFGVGFAVIADDDGPVVRAGNVEVTEADSDTTIDVPLTLSEPSSEEVTVDWHTINNSAAAPATMPPPQAPPPSSPVRPRPPCPSPCAATTSPNRESVVVALSNARTPCGRLARTRLRPRHRRRLGVVPRDRWCSPGVGGAEPAIGDARWSGWPPKGRSLAHRDEREHCERHRESGFAQRPWMVDTNRSRSSPGGGAPSPRDPVRGSTSRSTRGSG